MSRPKIGITTWKEAKPKAPYLTVSHNYVDSVLRAGGLPLGLPPSPDLDLAGAYLEGLDGLLITGGSDLWPRFYGEDPLPQVKFSSPDRDRWELALVQEARKRQVPLFGICRGHQVLNVAFGGSLWQDLPSQRPGSLGHSPDDLPMDELWHRIRLVPGDSVLRRICDEDEWEVNSFHHQAVKDLGPGLVATAHAADGTVEAFEARGEGVVMGVQFHPEALTARYPRFASLFQAFVDGCR